MKDNYLTQEQLESKWFSLWTYSCNPEDYAPAGLCGRVGFGEPTFPSAPKDLVGYFFIDKPFHREEVLHDVKFIYKNYEVQKVGEREGLVCRMRVKKKSREYLVPLDFKDIEEETGKQLLELVKNPPAPRLQIWYDEMFGYYRAKIAKEDLEI